MDLAAGGGRSGVSVCYPAAGSSGTELGRTVAALRPGAITTLTTAINLFPVDPSGPAASGFEADPGDGMAAGTEVINRKL